MTEKPTKEEKKLIFRSSMKWELVILAIGTFIIPEAAKLGLPYVLGTIALMFIGIVLFLVFTQGRES